MSFKMSSVGKLALLMFMAVACPTLTKGQQSTFPSAEVETTPATQEGYRRNGINTVNLSALLNTTKERAFVIAHLGDGEKSSRLNLLRLRCVEEMLINSKPEKFVLAQGTRVNGLGRIEFYLGSELMSVALVSRNGNICQLRRNINQTTVGAIRKH